MTNSFSGVRSGIVNIDSFQRVRGKRTQIDTEPFKDPQLRVIRRFSLVDSAENDAWRRYLELLGRKNEGVGTVRNLGQVAVTFATTKILRDVFDTNPNVSSSPPSQKLRTMRRLAKDYNDEVESKGSQIAESWHTAAGIDPSSSYQWLSGSVEIDPVIGAINNSHRNMGFTFKPSANRIFKEESSHLVSFLKAKNYDPKYIDQGDRHLSAIDLFEPIHRVSLEPAGVEVPRTIYLEAPRMIVIPNKPPK